MTCLILIVGSLALIVGVYAAGVFYTSLKAMLTLQSKQMELFYKLTTVSSAGHGAHCVPKATPVNE